MTFFLYTLQPNRPHPALHEMGAVRGSGPGRLLRPAHVAEEGPPGIRQGGVAQHATHMSELSLAGHGMRWMRLKSWSFLGGSDGLWLGWGFFSFLLFFLFELFVFSCYGFPSRSPYYSMYHLCM